VARRGLAAGRPDRRQRPRRIDGGLAAALPGSARLPLLVRSDLPWLRACATAGRRQQPLEPVGSRVQSGPPAELVASLGFGDTGWQSLIALMAGGCAVVMGGLTLWALRRVATDAIDRSWLRFCRRLAARPPAPGLGRPLDYASRLARERPEACRRARRHRRRLRPAALRPGRPTPPC
jgi:hypothetical protein